MMISVDMNEFSVAVMGRISAAGATGIAGRRKLSTGVWVPRRDSAAKRIRRVTIVIVCATSPMEQM
jgi:hypothetical protein